MARYEEIIVAAAGTPEQGDGTVAAPEGLEKVWVRIVANPANTGLIYVKDTDADMDKASEKLRPGDRAEYLIPSSTALYFDADVSGEKADIVAPLW